MRARAFLATILLAILLAAPFARAEPPAGALEAARMGYVDQLRALAQWCHRNTLHGKRDETYARLLQYAPDDEKARKRLKYKRDAEGVWQQNERYEPPPNRMKRRLPQYEENRAKADTSYIDSVVRILSTLEGLPDLDWGQKTLLALVAEFPENEQVAHNLRRVRLRIHQVAWDAANIGALTGIEQLLLEAHPEDADVRAQLGFVEAEMGWQREETARTLAQRRRLEAAAKQHLDTCKAALPQKLRPLETALAIEGLRCLATPHMRAVGTGKEEDLLAFARACEAAGPLFASAIGKAPIRRKQNTAYVFSKEGETDKFLDRYPLKDSPLLKMFDEFKLHVTWITSRSMILTHNPADAQLDLALNMLFTVMLSDTYFGSKDVAGWLDEGVARHLTYRLAGTRLSIGLAGRYGDKNKSGSREVPESKAPWLAAALRAAPNSKALDLRLMLGKGADAMTPKDRLMAYAFAVFLLEAHASGASQFLTRVGEGKDLDVASKEALGAPLPLVAYRMHRWLGEITSLPAASASSDNK
ncbi:MAG: hypothetical protein GY946_04505 [bacterium]|nr:hypothetical protein [bacterium]